MGLLSRLTGSSDGQISVQVEPEAAAPGDAMTVRLSIKEIDKKASGVRAGILCTGHYRVEENEKDSNGNITTNEVWQTVEIYNDEQTLDLRAGEQEAVFTLPDHIKPSSVGIVVWEAWGRIDRARGIDVVEQAEFTVRVPIARVADTRGTEPADDGMTITGLATAVEWGSSLTGTLVVDSDVTARAVKVRLHRRVVHVGEAINDYDVYAGGLVNGLLTSTRSKITDDVKVAEVEVGGKQEFEEGKRKEIPFEIDVPGAGPTSSHGYAQVDWRVEAVLDRRLRGDKSVEAQVIVV